MKLPEPVAAQFRLRRPEKTEHNWSEWQITKSLNGGPHYIDSRGWEVESRKLFTTEQLLECLATREAAMRQALKVLTPIHHGNMTPMAENAWKVAIEVLEEALE